MLPDLQAAPSPRPGLSRRSQNKRDLHARIVAAAPPAAPPPAKRMKVSARRAKTAPSKPSEASCSDVSSHTTETDMVPLNKAASCPPLAEGLQVDPDDAPGTPRIVPPAAAVPAASKSPPPETQISRGPRDASSGTPNAPKAVLVAAVADTAGTLPVGSPSPRASKSPDVTLAPSAPRLTPISTPLEHLNLHASTPATPTVVTPPPETPKMGRGRGKARGGRGASAEPRAGGYQGRFCGRLFLKEDEVKLAAECQLLGPLLGASATEGGPEHEAGRHTLAKIVRAVASGAVRAHCTRREAAVQELEAKLAAQQLAMRQSARRLAVENQAMRAQLGLLNKSIDALATAQALVPLPPTSAPAAAAPEPVVAVPASVVAVPASVAMPPPPPVCVAQLQQQRLISGFPQFIGPPLPQQVSEQPPATVMAKALTALPAATAAMLQPPPTNMGSFPMAATFASSRRSAFAPVPRSPSASGSCVGRVTRPTATVGVPPVALQRPITRV